MSHYEIGILQSSSLEWEFHYTLCVISSDLVKGVRSIPHRYKTFINDERVKSQNRLLVSIYDYLINQFPYLDGIGYSDIDLRKHINEEKKSHDFHKAWSQSDYLIGGGDLLVLELGDKVFPIEYEFQPSNEQIRMFYSVLPSSSVEHRFPKECFSLVKQAVESLSTQ